VVAAQQPDGFGVPKLQRPNVEHALQGEVAAVLGEKEERRNGRKFASERREQYSRHPSYVHRRLEDPSAAAGRTT
jgi:hypothetical protein